MCSSDLPIFAEHVIAVHGWRSAYFALGAVALLGFPLTACFLRNRSGEIGGTPRHQGSASLEPAFRARAFWIIAVCVMLSAFSMNALIAHLGAMLTGRGLSGSASAVALSALGISAIVARLFTGALLDRVPAPLVGCAVSLIAATGAALLAYAASPFAGIFGAILMGAGSGSEADVVPYMIAEYLGKKRFATLYGLSWTAYAIGGAIGPILVGRQFDKAGTYVPLTILLFSVPCFVAAFMQLALPIRWHAVWLDKEAALESL